MESQASPTEQPRKLVPVERQYLTIGAAAAVIAFVAGLAMNVGGKLNSLETLTVQVTKLESSIHDFTTSYQVDLKSEREDVATLKAEVKVLQEGLKDLRNDLQMERDRKAAH